MEDAKFEDPPGAEVLEEMLFKYGFGSGILRTPDRGGAAASDDMVGCRKGWKVKVEIRFKDVVILIN